jgi:hypothetical protein
VFCVLRYIWVAQKGNALEGWGRGGIKAQENSKNESHIVKEKENDRKCGENFVAYL